MAVLCGRQPHLPSVRQLQMESVFSPMRAKSVSAVVVVVVGVCVKINFVKRKPDGRTRGTDRLD